MDHGHVYQYFNYVQEKTLEPVESYLQVSFHYCSAQSLNITHVELAVRALSMSTPLYVMQEFSNRAFGRSKTFAPDPICSAVGP